jgi:DNA-binding Lrp family transcriptional regulator
MADEYRIVRTGDLDDLDRAILRELMRDGRMTNVELAERVHLSPSACLRRVRALEDRGVVESYVALLDAARAGLTGAAFVFVTLEQQGRAMLDAFERDARRHPEITECYLLAGTADYLLRIVFRDSRDLERIHTEILTQLPGVSRVQSTLSLRTVKKTTVLPI